MEKPNFHLNPQTPTFIADDILVDTQIKANKREDGTVEKVAKITLMGVDQQTKAITSRIVLDYITAERLGNILTETITKVKEELAKKDLPQQPQQPASTNENYIN